MGKALATSLPSITVKAKKLHSGTRGGDSYLFNVALVYNFKTVNQRDCSNYRGVTLCTLVQAMLERRLQLYGGFPQSLFKSVVFHFESMTH